MILGENSVDQAFIHLGSDEAIRLEYVDRQCNLWKYSATLPGDPTKNRFKYKYGFLKKGHDFTLPILGRIGMLSKDPSYCEESSEKQVRSQAQFDVFHFPEEKDYVSETIPEAIVFYLKWLLQFVNHLTISDTLNQIESLYIISLNGKYVKECVNWIVEHASGYDVSDLQRLYLCIVLSHLDSSLSPLPFPKDKKTAEACDRLLQCLNACVHSKFLSTSDLKRLEKIAIILVKNSNSPGRVTLAAHFYPYLGIKFVLDEKNTQGLNYTYDVKEYKKLVDTLLSHIKDKNGNDQVAYQDLLDLVLEHAPNLDAVWNLFESVDFCLFFTNEDEKVDFFVKFYQRITRETSTQKESAGAKLENLVEFQKIPEKIRGKMRKFLYLTLLEYAKSDDELNGEHVKIFLKSIISDRVLFMYQVLEILMELSKSKSVPCQNLLLEILNNERFEDWRETSRSRKVDICKSWVITRVVNLSSVSSLSGVDKIIAVFEAIDAIVQCSLNILYRNLAQEIFTYVVETILRKEDAISFLQAFASIEKCGTVVQDCYKFHVSKMLKQVPKVVKKSSKFLKECSSSRYYLISISFLLVF